jgi:hypothetical protein
MTFTSEAGRDTDEVEQPMPRLAARWPTDRGRPQPRGRTLGRRSAGFSDVVYVEGNNGELFLDKADLATRDQDVFHHLSDLATRVTRRPDGVAIDAFLVEQMVDTAPAR